MSEHPHDDPKQKREQARFREKVLQSEENKSTEKLDDFYDQLLIPIYHATKPSVRKLQTKLLPRSQSYPRRQN